MQAAEPKLINFENIKICCFRFLRCWLYLHQQWIALQREIFILSGSSKPGPFEQNEICVKLKTAASQRFCRWYTTKRNDNPTWWHYHPATGCWCLRKRAAFRRQRYLKETRGARVCLFAAVTEAPTYPQSFGIEHDELRLNGRAVYAARAQGILGWGRLREAFLQFLLNFIFYFSLADDYI